MTQDTYLPPTGVPVAPSPTETYQLQKRAAKSVLWLAVVCLVFAFACIALKWEPSERMLDFIVWIVGLTFLALTGSDGIELVASRMGPKK